MATDRVQVNQAKSELVDIEEVLRRHRALLFERFRVSRIGVFGSFARGEQTEGSDIDILVEFSEPIGWEFVDLQAFLENILGRSVDLVTVRALKPQLRDRILAEVAYA
jgi:hypothetical protein